MESFACLSNLPILLAIFSTRGFVHGQTNANPYYELSTKSESPSFYEENPFVTSDFDPELKYYQEYDTDNFPGYNMDWMRDSESSRFTTSDVTVRDSQMFAFTPPTKVKNENLVQQYLVDGTNSAGLNKRAPVQNCPPLYRRYSKQHTFCNPANLTCRVIDSGLKPGDIKKILKIHNDLRNKIALGRERINNYPPARNMMQLEWDDELMKVSEKHIAQCLFEHDCNECRQVENFPVGQNLYALYTTRTSPSNNPNWDGAIRSWYSEVSQAPSSIVSSYKPVADTGHFTQVIWAETWKVGCSYLAFSTPNDAFWKTYEMYFCNYGPGGNVLRRAIYEAGPTCSNCPSNTCCNKECSRLDVSVEYAGLCKSISPVGPQKNLTQGPDVLLFCDFLRRERQSDCSTVENGKPWTTRYIYSGAYKNVVLRSGQKTKITFGKTVKPKRGFCLRFMYRKGPNIAGQRSKNNFQITLRFPERGDNVVTKVTSDSSQYFTYSLHGDWRSETEVAFEFSVPEGAWPAQYLDIADVLVRDDPKC